MQHHQNNINETVALNYNNELSFNEQFENYKAKNEDSVNSWLEQSKYICSTCQDNGTVMGWKADNTAYERLVCPACHGESVA